MGAKERIRQYLDYRGISPYQFYKKTGFSNGFLDSGIGVGSDKIEIIIEKYPDINLSWLISGDGNMVKDEAGTNYITRQNKTTEQPLEIQKIATVKQSTQMSEDFLMKLLQQKDADLRKMAEEIGARKEEIKHLREKKTP